MLPRNHVLEQTEVALTIDSAIALVELMSPSTARVDLTTKKTLYKRTFHSPDYYAYDPNALPLRGWHLQNL